MITTAKFFLQNLRDTTFGSILAGIIDQIEENLLDHRDICVHLRIVSGARSHLQDQCQQEDSQAFWRP